MYSIVIPVYKESECLPILLEEIKKTVSFIEYEVIVVDDSEDNETKTSCERFFVDSNWTYIHRQQRKGLASAVIEGFSHALGEWLICMDGDGSHSPEMIKYFSKNIKSDHEIFVGSRYIKEGNFDSKWPAFRHFVSKLSCLLVWPLAKISDPMSGCFAVKKQIITDKSSLLDPLGYKILLEILVKLRVKKVKEIPLDFRLRFKGDSKITLKIMLESLVHLFKLYKFVIFFKR